jgi:hypothetical protein
MVAAVAGVAWTLWGASGLAGSGATVVRAVGIVVGSAMVGEIARTRADALQDEPPAVASGGSRSMFGSRSYLVVAILEVAAIVIGNKLLAATGHNDYTIAWVATVLGLHFLALGRLFFAGFYWLGLALIMAGLIGAAVGGAGGGADGIKAASGLSAAASLFGAGAWTLVAQSRARKIGVLTYPT